ncbi:MAG TPA: hypothetical protein VG708_09125 [Mycobacteriales bacterium]|nr:hypothetical protein [Mycobacteriales bacterium]
MSPPVEPGQVLDGRYRLDRLCREHPAGSLWQATDEVLGRAVAVRLVPDVTRQDIRRLTAAAGRAGRVRDARWVRVLDIGSEPSGRRHLAWIVTEWVEGTPLAELVRHQQLEATAATRLALECAQAVAAAQEAGACHGQLHPDEVIVTADATPRLTGLELRGLDEPAAAADTQAVGGLLYVALTGHWPLPGWHRLPPPSRGDGRHPRRERRGIRRDLDEVVARAVGGGYPDAAALARALATLPVTPRRTADDVAASREQRRRWAWRIVPPVIVLGLAAAAWTAGREIGKVPGQDQLPVSNVPQPGQLGPHRLVWSTPPPVREFDLPDHRRQDPGGVGLAVDGDPTTSWVSDTYRTSAPPSATVAGVGLLLDLGKPAAVRTARLLLSDPGAAIEVRAGDHRPKHPTDLPLVAQATKAKANLKLHLHPRVHARYWLIWITGLPHTGAGYRLGVEEIALLR